MTTQTIRHALQQTIRHTIETLLTREHGAPVQELALERRPLRGGLEAASIELVAAAYRGPGGRAHRRKLVVKRLRGATAREALVYERLVSQPSVAAVAPRLLGVERPSAEEAVLYVEALRPVRAWPWRDLTAAHDALAQAARIHALAVPPELAGALGGWDYDRELNATAARTVERLADVRRQTGLRRFTAGHRWARRLTGALPALRRQLVGGGPLGCTLIHGDLHPGNVLLRRHRGREAAVLIDWGRARLGSPLEDLSCWLQSLAAWEPVARQRHDTLLAGYLTARGLSPRLGPELRAGYWLAGASNALSGALLYHVEVMLDASAGSAARVRAEYAAREWLRVLRRADAFWS
ncbi:MAG TPA: phosphotransferase [Gemmatimonadales bacterium]|nr:phosphotransferase [Gemmatimonadales bacterium]